MNKLSIHLPHYIMKSLFVLVLVAGVACAFVPSAQPPLCSVCHFAAGNDDTASITLEDRLQHERFQDIAKRLRTSIHSNGFDSRDPKYGVETIKAELPVNPSLGLELTEVAHSTTQPDCGLVLVSRVSDNAAKYTSIQEGDTIVGVSCEGFKQSTAGLDYDATIDAIVQAKTQTLEQGRSTISLQVNRLVPRAPVRVILENYYGAKPLVLEGLTGDNLQSLLKKNKIDFTVNDCGGQGICATCLVSILEGNESLDYLDASSSLSNCRKACQTIVGANNQESTVRLQLGAPSSTKGNNNASP